MLGGGWESRGVGDEGWGGRGLVRDTSSVHLQVPVGGAQAPPAGVGPVSQGRPGVGLLVKAQPERVADHQPLHDEGGAEPGQGVLGCDQAHEVVLELGVVPGAGVELAQEQTCAKLPQVGPERVDDTSQQGGAAAAQLQVHVLHDQDACPVDEECPHAGHARELPVAVDHELPGGCEHDLTEVAVDGIQVPARQHRQWFGGCRGRHGDRLLTLGSDAGGRKRN